MAMLMAGVLGWSLIHLMPSLLPDVRKRLRERLGGNGYKLLFTLGILGSLGLIIGGWRSTEPEFLYHFSFARHITYLLMLVAVACLVAAKSNSHLRGWLRHPQLTGVFIWSAAHLLVNGDSRSLVLFGGFALWTVLEMLLINRRDGRPEKFSGGTLKGDMVVAVITVIVVVVLMLLHPYLSGMPLIRVGG